MECPKCGGPMWDNRASKKSPKQPDYRCKDRENCQGAIWPPKGQQAAGGQGRPNAAPSGPRRPLGPLYYDCLKMAKACVEKELKGAMPADVIAAAATLFIAATRDGTPLTAPKPKPTPPPEPEYEETGDSDYDLPDELPF